MPPLQCHKWANLPPVSKICACWWKDPELDSDPYKYFRIQILEAQKLQIRIRNTGFLLTTSSIDRKPSVFLTLFLFLSLRSDTVWWTASLTPVRKKKIIQKDGDLSPSLGTSLAPLLKPIRKLNRELWRTYICKYRVAAQNTEFSFLTFKWNNTAENQPFFLK